MISFGCNQVDLAKSTQKSTSNDLFSSMASWRETVASAMASIKPFVPQPSEEP